LIDGEKNIIRVAGVIRPSDIDATNTIDSKYISDAKIEYKTEGEIERATNKNWFAKFLDAVSPF
jgi:flagellar L-ring protein precursor FlgH